MDRLVGVLIGLVVLGVVFGVMERAWPAVRGQRGRRGLITDVCYFFWDPFVNRLVTVIAVALAVTAAALLAGVHPDGASIREWAGRNHALAAQPLWLQAVEVLVISDFLSYAGHRLFHEVAALWRVHLVHHSSTQLDWLAAARVHPLNEAGMRVVQVVPFVLAGFRPELVAGLVPVLTVYAIFLHANVPWDFGRLRYVVASPRFHRWHHTSENEGLNKNYAGLFPWIDALFGTLYLPAGRQPQVFGVAGEAVPNNLLRQLVYPFRRTRTGLGVPG